MWKLVQVTVQYSHAVLVAILPYVTDFSKHLGLPVSTPITTNQVSEFKCDPRFGQTGGMLTLTNGDEFTFLDGRVTVYHSPKSYFSVQDPASIPGMYGTVKITEAEAVNIALGTIEKLGYTKDAFNANSPPVVTLPEKVGTNCIARYRFRWLEAGIPALHEGTAATPAMLDIEVNAENGEIEMVVITSRETRRPSPKVDVVPAIVTQPPASNNRHGSPTQPVNPAYAKAFLDSILPQLSEFIANAGLNNSVPHVTNSSVVTNYICRIADGQPIAQLYLTNGDRFNYEHGHFDAFYAHDAMDKFPETGNSANFLGHINMTTNEAISLCVQIVKKLGYTNGLSLPMISYARSLGSLACTRYRFAWRHTGNDSPFASFEVDMETRRVKSMFLRDPVFERQPPKIDARIAAENTN